MEPVSLKSDGAPSPRGCYSSAVRIGNLIFTAGQVPRDSQTNKLVSGAIEQQTERIIQNIKALLEDNGTSLANVLKSTIFIRQADQWEAVNSVYSRYFEDTIPPARTVIPGINFQEGLDIEMEVVAFIPE